MSHRKSVVVLGVLLILFIGSVVGFCLTELGYRIYLVRAQPDMFAQANDAHPDVFFFQNPVWQFDREFGYTYVPNSRWQTGFISRGILKGCDGSAVSNSVGNMGGRHQQPYETAEVKMLVFGDSVTAQVRNGNVTYPDLLADKLSGELGRSVGVMNFGRDGYGVLQMFDLARRKISELKPDIALIVFITDDLTRDRFWRTSVTIDGRRRMLTTIEPDPTPPLGKSADTVILEDQASADWCKQQITHPDPRDSVLMRLEETSRIVQRHSQNKPTPYLLSQSFVFERLAYGEPFAFVYRNLPPATNPRHKLTDFNADPGFADVLLDIKASGVPIVLLHLAIYEELRDRQYALSTDQLRSLVKSLSRTVEPVYPTLEYSDLDTPDLAKIKHAPNDGAHPSVWGMDFHANAMLRILKANGQLNPLIGKGGSK